MAFLVHPLGVVRVAGPVPYRRRYESARKPECRRMTAKLYPRQYLGSRRHPAPGYGALTHFEPSLHSWWSLATHRCSFTVSHYRFVFWYPCKPLGTPESVFSWFYRAFLFTFGGPAIPRTAEGYHRCASGSGASFGCIQPTI